MHEASFIARPTRSLIAETQFRIRKVGAGISTPILTGLPPERQPLAGMAVTHSLDSAHSGKYHNPDRDVRQVSLERPKRSAELCEIESPEKLRARDSINALYRQIQ
jgi:hypothetical protein